MATERQLKGLYWPAWARGWRANWERRGGRVWRRECPAARRNVWADRVERAAEGMARSAGEALDANWMRHGAHWVALGRDASSKGLGNVELDRVLVLFRLLEAPLDLGAVMAWERRGEDGGGDRRRLEWGMRHLPHSDEYVRAVCADKFGTRRWEGLGAREMRQLLMTLKNRGGKDEEGEGV